MSDESKSNDRKIQVLGCLYLIFIIVIVPILMHTACNGNPINDIINKKYEKLK